jgi:hypothetical protein
VRKWLAQRLREISEGLDPQPYASPARDLEVGRRLAVDLILPQPLGTQRYGGFISVLVGRRDGALIERVVLRDARLEDLL